MSLAAFAAAGAFVDPAPEEKTIDWKGQTFRVWIVRQSAYEMQRALRALKDSNQLTLEDPDIARYVLIHLNFRFGEDMEQMSLSDALRLSPDLLDALEKCFNSVPAAPKASRPKKKAGAN